MSLARVTARPLTPEQTASLVNKLVSEVCVVDGLKKIILIGSAAEGRMSEASDIDLVLIFESKDALAQGRKKVHLLRKPPLWPCDLLCVDEPTYAEKALVGGIFFVAREEGKVVWEVKP